MGNKKKAGGASRNSKQAQRRDRGKTWQRGQDGVEEAMDRLKLKENQETDSEEESSEDENSSQNEIKAPFQVAMWDVGQVCFC